MGIVPALPPFMSDGGGVEAVSAMVDEEPMDDTEPLSGVSAPLEAPSTTPSSSRTAAVPAAPEAWAAIVASGVAEGAGVAVGEPDSGVAAPPVGAPFSTDDARSSLPEAAAALGGERLGCCWGCGGGVC